MLVVVTRFVAGVPSNLTQLTEKHILLHSFTLCKNCAIIQVKGKIILSEKVYQHEGK